MAEIVNYADLSGIENNIGRLAENLNVVASNLEYVNEKVNGVDHKVEYVTQELRQLAEEFAAFAHEQQRVQCLADAKQNVVILEQKLEKEYGYYEEVRKHIVGILQATDLEIVRKETITEATENLMIKTPRYWLTPALIALSAWISDDKELADRALKEAMKRDDEKTSLLFCLICRRAGRLNGSLVWLDRYFAMQDPEKMERRIITVLDAYACGLFGQDANGLCSQKINSWLDELSSKSGFIDKQKEQWSKHILGKKVFLNDGEFPYLAEHSETWAQMKDILEWAKTHNDIYTYFSNIFNTPVENMMGIQSKIDNILDSLVKNYDNDELPLRRDLRKNQLVIEENGILKNANLRIDAEMPSYEQYCDFSYHLTNITFSPEASGALIPTQKLAISISKDWILQAYEDLTAKSRASIPSKVNFKISDWSGSTTDGSNEKELIQSLNKYVDDDMRLALSQVKWLTSGLVVGLAIAVLLGLISLKSIIGPIIAGVVGVIMVRNAKKNERDTKSNIINSHEDFRKNATETLRAILAEVVDYRRLFKEKDAEYDKVINFISSLTPEQFIVKQSDDNTRRIIRTAN